MENNNVVSILEDIYGRLWLGTNKGITVLDTKTNYLANFSTINDFPQNRYNPGACFKANNGDLYFGGAYGLIKITPNRMFDTSSISRILITKIISTEDDQEKIIYQINSFQILFPNNLFIIETNFYIRNFKNNNIDFFRLIIYFK